MSKPTKKTNAKRRKLKEAEAVEVHPDAWERFESTVRRIIPPRKDGAKGKTDAGGKPTPTRDSSE